MLPHYYNLNSDYKVGYIDRHNYFDGKGPEMFASMLTRPGSGYLGSGLQQVVDRPFGLSEWIHVYPNVYAAEGPAIVAAYGMGLQGWDASYEFQSQAEPPGLRRHRRRLPLGRLGGGRAHVAGPVPRPGPDDLPRRRQGGRGHLGASRQPGRPGRGPASASPTRSSSTAT